jgi:N6-L-threonylcarbamoyladenine synthase
VDTLILGIESSCDETAAAVARNGREVLSNVIYSQIDIHTEFGGVVPEIASRKHIEKIDSVVEKAIKDAGIFADEITAVAVTKGPGLVGPLLVGVSFAKAYAYALDKPLVGVHHIRGHVAANYIEHPELKPPFLSLIVSGGHTHLVRVTDYDSFEVLGLTQDDAAGEAYDKVARAIGLGYPGGPKIDKISKEGNPEAYNFPRAKVGDSPFDFSFSGVKSAVLNQLNAAKMKGEEINQADVAASFQKAVTDVLVSHAVDCAKSFGEKRIALAGGVASNTALRAALKEAGEENGIDIIYPSPVYCTDNAAMIACQGYYEYMKGSRAGLDLNAVPNLKL